MNSKTRHSSFSIFPQGSLFSRGSNLKIYQVHICQFSIKRIQTLFSGEKKFYFREGLKRKFFSIQLVDLSLWFSHTHECIIYIKIEFHRIAWRWKRSGSRDENSTAVTPSEPSCIVYCIKAKWLDCSRDDPRKHIAADTPGRIYDSESLKNNFRVLKYSSASNLFRGFGSFALRFPLGTCVHSEFVCPRRRGPWRIHGSRGTAGTKRK